jgi:lysophospholipase L1-like esterase
MIVFVNNYDPFVGLVTDVYRRVQATFSVTAVAALNNALASAFAANGARVSDVYGAFNTTDRTVVFATRGYSVTRAAQRACALTFMCGGAPRSDLHANTAGYALIADTIAATLAA